MRHRNSNKGNPACKSCHTGRENTGKQNQCDPERLNIHAHILGIAFSQLISSYWFRHQKSNDKRCHDYNCHRRNIFPGRSRKTSHRPVMKIYDVGIIRKVTTKSVTAEQIYPIMIPLITSIDI